MTPEKLSTVAQAVENMTKDEKHCKEVKAEFEYHNKAAITEAKETEKTWQERRKARKAKEPQYQQAM